MTQMSLRVEWCNESREQPTTWKAVGSLPAPQFCVALNLPGGALWFSRLSSLCDHRPPPTRTVPRPPACLRLPLDVPVTLNELLRLLPGEDARLQQCEQGVELSEAVLHGRPGQQEAEGRWELQDTQK